MKTKWCGTLPTTSPNSNSSSFPRRARLGWVLLVCAGIASGCVTRVEDPATLFTLTPESAQHRALQTRFFETTDEHALLSASAAVLQDLGFQIQESVRDLALLRASKERSAYEYGQDISKFFVAAAGVFGQTIILIPIDLHQKIGATLALRPADTQGKRYSVRITFYRVIWESDGQSGEHYIPPGSQRMEMIHDAKIYQQFFAKLSKSVFLEAHKI
ncbi:conserved protein of unknown function [Nitrospina watsonii]|uniref:DUF4136 domain-containing protein n=1 Tax=Nitrospina watsonii TaxID=1323948 RepID=A0ABM9HHI4_9BACT|nr:conserved protein of unknown function [Nitrospina watsonii]